VIQDFASTIWSAPGAPPDLRALEQACLNAVPAPYQAFDGPLLFRAFLGGTGRANSIVSLSPENDAGLQPRIARMEARAAARGIACRFRSTPLDPPGLETLLRARGYTDHDETLVLLGPLGGMVRPDAAVRALSGPDTAWMEVVGTAEYQVDARRAEKARMPELLAVPAAWLVLEEDGMAAASLFVVADGTLCGMFDLAVRPEYRRRGLAARIMGAGAAWAAQRGAIWKWSQVSATNTASLMLNARMGMGEMYRYRYFRR
jgi:GNAT superfamily N-acetyltransferase